MSENEESGKFSIPGKIVGFRVLPKEGTEEDPESTTVKIPSRETMHEGLKRPEMLNGSTYKIKQPSMEHALYLTINDMVINEGTEHESLLPYEIFLNCKNMEHHQWVLALTRTISAVFRKGGEVTFLIEELKSVFDPKGGYWKKGVYIHSLVAEVGMMIEHHLQKIGVIEIEVLTDDQKDFLDKKRGEIAGEHVVVPEEDGYPDQATLCPKCSHRSVVILDKCATCLNCADSKCG